MVKDVNGVLTSPGSGPISAIGRLKNYYVNPKRDSIAAPTLERSKFDSATFSSAVEGKGATHLSLVSRLSQEVRTATTTGVIQQLHKEVSSGEYEPDPMAIAGKILFQAEG